MKQFLNAPAKLGTRTPIVSASTFLTITTIFNLQHYNHEECVPLMMLTMKVTLEEVGEQNAFVGFMQAYKANSNMSFTTVTSSLPKN